MINPKKMIEILHSIFVIDNRDAGLASGNRIGMLKSDITPTQPPQKSQDFWGGAIIMLSNPFLILLEKNQRCRKGSILPDARFLPPKISQKFWEGMERQFRVLRQTLTTNAREFTLSKRLYVG